MLLANSGSFHGTPKYFIISFLNDQLVFSSLAARDYKMGNHGVRNEALVPLFARILKVGFCQGMTMCGERSDYARKRLQTHMNTCGRISIHLVLHMYSGSSPESQVQSAKNMDNAT